MDPKILLSFALGLALAGGVSYFVTRRAEPVPAAAPQAAVLAPVKAVESAPVAAAPVPPAPVPAKPVVKRVEVPKVVEAAKVAPAPVPVAPAPAPVAPAPAPAPVAAAPAPTPVPVPEPASAVARIFEPRTPEPPRAAEPAPAPVPAKAPVAEGPHSVTLDQGTILNVRVLETLSSDKNREGDTFLVTLDQPLVVDGFVIAERGAQGEGKIVELEQAGRVKGVARMALELTRFTSADGQTVLIKTQSLERVGATSKKEDAEKVGIGAALGSLIGAAAGGGKGAGVGAAAGGAAGAGAVLLTRGKPATVASESKLSFRLDEPVTLTERGGQ